MEPAKGLPVAVLVIEEVPFNQNIFPFSRKKFSWTIPAFLASAIPVMIEYFINQRLTTKLFTSAPEEFKSSAECKAIIRNTNLLIGKTTSTLVRKRQQATDAVQSRLRYFFSRCCPHPPFPFVPPNDPSLMFSSNPQRAVLHPSSRLQCPTSSIRSSGIHQQCYRTRLVRRW